MLKGKNTTLQKQLDVASQKKVLVGHVPIELSRLMKNLLEANTENKLVAQVTRKGKREIGLVSARFAASTTDLGLAKILETEYAKEL